MDINMEVMLENEAKNSSDRLSYLEKHVQQQNDELICLKSALADVIRRMQLIENTQSTQQQQLHNKHRSPHKLVPSSKSMTTRKQILKDSQDSKNSTQLSHSINSTISEHFNGSIHNKENKLSLSRAERSHGSLNGSKANSIEKLAPTKKTLQVSVDYNQQPLSLNSDSGLVKFYIRGRPINIYLPKANQVSSNSNEIGFKFDTETKLKAPKEQLKLEWIYGYRGKDCRSNLYQLPTGEIIYFIAATVILFNPEEHTQRHYTGHTDDVKSLAIHPDKITIATGQVTGHDKHEGKAHVRIWDSLNLTTLKIIGLASSDFTSSISCLSFSKVDGGKQLVVVDEGNDRWMSVWNWQTGYKSANAKCYGDLVFAAEFHPTDKNIIVTCGKQHIFFWNLDNAQHLTKRSGIFELYQNAIVTSGNGVPVPLSYKIEKPKYILCISFGINGEVISGDSEGNIIFWSPRDNKIIRLIKDAHENGIFSILFLQNQQNCDTSCSSGDSSESNNYITMITGGGKDGKLYEWNQDYEKTGRTLQIPETNGTCRFITSGKGNNLFLVGTTKNTIYQANFEMSYLNCLVNSHVEELWGVCSNPRESCFITCGNDKNLYYWDSLSHSLLWSAQLEDQLHCVSIHPQYDLAAIGFAKSKWTVFDLIERKCIFSQVEGTEQIECIQYSPNGKYLAAGSRDNSIYIYAVNDQGYRYSRIGRCYGHSSFITHIDWSADSEFLMSNSGDYEILIWHAKTCKQVTQVQQIREISYHTNNCTISLNTLGIWNSTDVVVTNGEASSPRSYDGTDVNACAKSDSNNLLATVDDFGKVNLYAYPCNACKSEKRVYSGHSSHVTNVTFLNDTRLITTGGNDMAIFQWAVVNE